MKKIQILLSTYNGERHIQEQLDSFLSLDNYSEIKVLIRDDGSSDSTPDILREYAEAHGFEVIYGENVGLNRSLYELLLKADRECEFFAFADQDDVWLSDKLSRARDALREIPEYEPALYAACSNLTDSELNITGHTLIPKRTDFFNAMVQNVCIGHTQVFNRAHLSLLSSHYTDEMMIMDYWSYLIASSLGKVIYDKKPTTLYRQHSDNVIGYSNSFFGTLKTRIRRVKTKKSAKNASQLRAFLDLFGDKIPEEHKAEGERFFRRQRNFFTRLSYISVARAYRQTFAETLIFKLMYLFGRYNIDTRKGDSK